MTGMTNIYNFTVAIAYFNLALTRSFKLWRFLCVEKKNLDTKNKEIDKLIA